MHYTVAGVISKDRFTVNGYAESPQFEVRRIYGLDGNSLSLRNMEGKELAAIRELASPTRFEITIDGAQPITVHHQGWFGRRYSIATPSGGMAATVGDFSPENYRLTSSGMARATVSRQQARPQNLRIDMADGENAVPLIAIVLAIETLREGRRQAQDSIPIVQWVLRLIN